MSRRRQAGWTFAAIATGVITTASGTLSATPTGDVEYAPSGPRGSDLVLWYDEPATSWESQGLPIGNGHLGGVIFGQVGTERVQFNEKTLWSGGPAPDHDYVNGNWRSPRPTALADARQLINDETQVSPGPITELLGQNRDAYGSYTTFGELQLDFGDLGEVTDYVRDLDIGDSTASVRYRASDVNYTREYFASYPDGVLVTRLTADQAAGIDVDVSQTVPAGRSNTQVTRDGARLTVAGNLDDNQLRFESQLLVTAEGGTVGGTATAVSVTGANAVTIILGAGTDYADEYPAYRGENPHDRVTAAAAAAAGAAAGAAAAVAATPVTGGMPRVTQIAPKPATLVRDQPPCRPLLRPRFPNRHPPQPVRGASVSCGLNSRPCSGSTTIQPNCPAWG